jgi:hypothetical protein
VSVRGFIRGTSSRSGTTVAARACQLKPISPSAGLAAPCAYCVITCLPGLRSCDCCSSRMPGEETSALTLTFVAGGFRTFGVLAKIA